MNTKSFTRPQTAHAVLLPSISILLALAAFAETFTEGKRVPPTAEKLKAGDFVWEPERAPVGPVLIVVSKPEQVAYVSRNGVEIGRAPFARNVNGMHVYSALDGADAEGRRKWVRVDGAPAAKDPSFTELSASAGIPATFISGVRSVVQPGTTMVLTDKPVNANTQSKPGFKVMGLGEVAAR